MDERVLNRSGIEMTYKCDNCQCKLKTDSQIGGAIKSKIHDTDDVGLHIWDALEYIYGVSWNSFQNHNSKTNVSVFQCPEKINFCDACVSLLSQSYNSLRLFENSCNVSSPVQFLKEFRSQKCNVSKLNDQTIGLEFAGADETEGEKISQETEETIFDNFHNVDNSDYDLNAPLETIESKYEPPTTFSEYETPDKINFIKEEQLDGPYCGSKKLIVKAEKLSPEEINEYSKQNKKRSSTRKLSSVTRYTDEVRTTNRTHTKLSSRKVAKKPQRRAGPHRTRTKAQGEELAKEVVNYYKTVANCSSKLTWRHFKMQGIPRATIYKNILKYKDLDDVNNMKFKKITGRPPKPIPIEDLRCNLCDKQFKKREHIKRHNQVRHSISIRERKFSCDQCPLKFFDKQVMEKHQIVHGDLRRYVCEECGRTYKHNFNFREHLKCHKDIKEKGESAFKCDECGGMYKHSLSLKLHKYNKHPKQLKILEKLNEAVENLNATSNIN